MRCPDRDHRPTRIQSGTYMTLAVLCPLCFGTRKVSWWRWLIWKMGEYPVPLDNTDPS